MALDADALIDRRRLKRRLFLWQALAVIALILLIAVSAGRRLPAVQGLVGAHVARLSVDGLIVNDAARNQTIDALAKDPAAKALIVSIDSPGGTVIGGETLYDHLRRLAKVKPVVAVMGGTAASAAYMAALGADHIVAHEGTVTGSIGVLLQTFDATGLLNRLGVKALAIKSAPLKAVPSPIEPLTPAGRAATQDVVNDIFHMFVGLVAERRHLSPEAALKLADGRVYTGRQALKLGLVDELGGEGAAMAWLVKAKGLDPALPIRPLTVERPGGLWHDLFSSVIGKPLFSERLSLDGLVALWQPDSR